MVDQLIDRLLMQTALIVDRHTRYSRSQGGEFNIFKVLGRTADEVNGHSALIAELLDPNGSHGQGNLFLALFLSNLRKWTASSWPGLLEDNKKWIVRRELPFTLQDAPYADVCGRLDIILSTGDDILIIENKIYARDQSAQLDRYCQYARERGKRPFLIYLTLDGRDPDSQTLGTLVTLDKKDRDVFSLSYCDFINTWLLECIQSVALRPALREVLAQYRKLVIQLCHGIENKEMMMEIVDLITPEQFPAAVEISRAVPLVKIRVQTNFWKAMQEKLSHKFNNNVKYLDWRMWNEETIKNYYLASWNRPDYFGLNIPLMELASGRMIIFSLLHGEGNYYSAFHVHEPGNKEFFPWREEGKNCAIAIGFIQDIANQLGIALEPSGKNILGGWWYPKDRINFKDFNEGAFQLIGSHQLVQVTNALSDEAAQVIRLFSQKAKTTKINGSDYTIFDYSSIV